jgi:hypothetical protein
VAQAGYTCRHQGVCDRRRRRRAHVGGQGRSDHEMGAAALVFTMQCWRAVVRVFYGAWLALLQSLDSTKAAPAGSMCLHEGFVTGDITAS